MIAACVGLAGLIAAFMFNVEARKAAVEVAATKRERERTELMRRAPLSAVEETDPTRIGVDPAAQDILAGGEVPEYVARDVDDVLREAIEAALDGSGRWLVVVMGPSKVGKSRALFQAVTECARRRPLQLVAPENADALRACAAFVDEPTQPRLLTVLWLDDLEPFLNDGVTMATLREWRASARGGIVVATYGGKGSELIAGSTAGGLTTIAADVLQSARQIALAATTAREISALSSHVSADQLASLERHGLAAYLVAAPALERKLATRRHAPGTPECPDGAAVVLAAVDWARCGRTDPISHDELRRLWPSYLPPGVVATDDAFELAVAWAIRPVAGPIALLHRTGSYQAFDYVVRLLRERSGAEPPRNAAWAAAIHSAGDAQALAVGFAAFLRGRLDKAAEAFSRARESSLDDVGSLARVNLGVVLGWLGRSDDALAVYDEVVTRFGDATDSVLRKQVADALVYKGIALGKLERSGEAVGVYDEVVARFGDATDPALREEVANALVKKGWALTELERSGEAVGVYDEVVARFGDATDPALRRHVATALLHKGITLALAPSGEAVVAYDEVVARFGDATDATEPGLRRLVANALVNKGIALGEQERSAEAVGVYEEVVTRFGDATDSVLREQVAMALYNKGRTLEALERFGEAVGVYDEIVARFADATEPALRKLVAVMRDERSQRTSD